jgi:DNA-binding SARP family transcriptional activator
VATGFQILGPLRVTVADTVEVDVGGAKPAALLAILLLRPNELVAADRLIEELWDGQPPATAAKTLQVHISRMRRALTHAQGGDGSAAIGTRGHGYVLELDPETIDAVRFERLVAEGTAALAADEHARASARLRAALALWRGDALADFTYASFAQDAIARLDGLRTVALESAVAAELELGRHTELIPELKSLVQRNPLSEHLRGQLMLALYRAGRQAEALGVYRAGRRVLVDQLGLEPSQELRELEAAILVQDPKLSAKPGTRPRPERTGRSTRATMVGYEWELSALEDLLEDALLGRGGIALVAGEPGIGKTRLVDELSVVAQARGARVLTGRCRSGTGAPVYWPWVQVLRALVADRDGDAVRAELGPHAAQLAQLVPDLADMAPPPPTGAPEDVRFALFDAFGSALRRAAASTPLVVVLDDLHAADASSLELLQFMSQVAVGAPVLIVASYRDTEVERGTPLTEALSELARTSDCLQLLLTGLTEEGTAHLVEVSAGVEPMPRLAEAIHEVSGGNPLFVSELVRLLRTEGRLRELRDDDRLVLPRGVDQVIERRIAQLPAKTRTTLCTAAVVGREFDSDLVARAEGRPASDALDVIEAAVSARVVEHASGKRYRFTHDLIRQVLYTAIGAGERVRLHGAVAMAMEEMHALRPEPVASALAHHFSEALPEGDAQKAVRYLTLAAERALAVSAYHEGSMLLSRAAETAHAHGFDAEAVFELYLQLAEALVVWLSLRQASEALEKADALAADLPDDPRRNARLALVRAYMVLMDAGPQVLEEVQDAIELFEQVGDPAGAARAWEMVALIHCGGSRRTAEHAAAERMLECAKRAGSSALIARALRALASASAHGVVPEAIDEIRGLLARAPDATTRARITNTRALLRALQGRFDEARATVAESWAMLPATERVRLHDHWLGIATRVEVLAENWVRAEDLARQLSDSYRREGLMAYFSSEAMFLADVLVAQGRLDEAEELLEEAALWAADDDVDAQFRQARTRARLELARGNLDAAEAAARRSLSDLEQAQSTDELVETMLVFAQVLRALGREAEATDAAAEALRLSTERGNLVFAQRARRMLDAPPAVAARV